MDRVGDLMRQMGFREDADDDTKKAFIRHLVKAAFSGKGNTDEVLRRETTMTPEDAQLSFELDYQERNPSTGLIKKSS